jgi:hypothetical protein
MYDQNRGSSQRGGHGGAHGGRRDHGGYGGGQGGYGGGRGGDRGSDRGGDRGERRGMPLSELDPTLTDMSRRVIGCAIEVHKASDPASMSPATSPRSRWR